MRISTKSRGMNLLIILQTLVIMVFTLTSLSNISDITTEHQNKNIPLMTTSLSIQKDIIQIQQWLTDVSATRGKPGFDDGFDIAEEYYNSANEKIQDLKRLGIEDKLIDSITKDLDQFYKMGIEMANAYINNGTEAGNIFMERFDPYADRMEEAVDVLLEVADTKLSDGNNLVSSQINKLFRRSMIVFGLIVLLSVITYFVTQKLVLAPLNMITNILKDISEGDGDLTKRVDIKSKDEIGEMARYFNNFAETVNKIVLSVKELSKQVTLASEELVATSQQSASTAEEVAQTIDEIAKGATHQALSTNEGSEKLMVLGNLIEENKKRMEIFKEASNKVNELVKDGLSIIDKLAIKTEESSNATNSVYESVIKTNKSSKKISEASNLITSIAQQTNLLALNATIEAARAGEHGKGFVVVAEEIRELAEQSTKSTKIIDDMIRVLQQDAAIAVEAMKKVEKTLREQFENVNITEDRYKEIAEEINKTGEVVEEIDVAENEMEQRKNEVLNSIKILSELAEENAAGTEQASASMEEQTAAVAEIANSSAGLSELFEELQTMIERFKV